MNLHHKPLKLRATWVLSIVCSLSSLWSPLCQACTEYPVVSSMCLMSWPNNSDFNNTYLFADGRAFPANQYAKLYSVIGNTYGGSIPKFNIPDLRGRMVLGAGQSDNTSYAVTSTGGSATVSLSIAQLPMHIHALIGLDAQTKLQFDMGSLSANTSLPGLTATTSLASVSATAGLSNVSYYAPATGLTLNAASGSATSNQPAGLAVASANIYTAITPAVPMNTTSIGGNLNATASGNAPVTFTGTPATTLNGTFTTTITGVPSATFSGSTDVAGISAPVPILPPYLALNYYIANNGAYPIIPISP